MAIEKRNLEAGTRLVGRYKGKTVVCLVEADDGGAMVFRLEGETKTYRSLSSAATEITKGPINGWKFWSLEGEAPTATTKPAKEPKSKEKRGAGRGAHPRGPARSSTWTRNRRMFQRARSAGSATPASSRSWFPPARPPASAPMATRPTTPS